jgi:hypothetical protein
MISSKLRYVCPSTLSSAPAKYFSPFQTGRTIETVAALSINRFFDLLGRFAVAVGVFARRAKSVSSA